MPTFVIVGGSHDGDRIIQDGVYPHILLRKKRSDRLIDGPEAGMSFREDTEREMYKPHDWATTDRKIMTIYALAGMSDLEVMERLIDGYRRPIKA